MAMTKMKAQYSAAAVTHPGFEDIAAAEVGELIGVKAAAADGVVNFPIRQLSDLCRLCYSSQSAVSLLLDGSRLDLGVREYDIFGDNGGISGSLAYLLLRASGYTGREFLFDPFTRSGAFAIEAALFSSGFSVNHYRKAALASHLSRLPQFKGIDFGAVFADALKKRAKPQVLCSSPLMQDVRFAEKNAKIAGVNKFMRFSRLDIKWLDAKLGEKSVDMVVSYPPQFRAGSGSFAAAENQKLLKLYREFFYHADFFMKPDGRVCLALRKGSYPEVLAAAAAYKFKPAILREFKVGGQEFELVRFGKDLKASQNRPG